MQKSKMHQKGRKKFKKIQPTTKITTILMTILEYLSRLPVCMNLIKKQDIIDDPQNTTHIQVGKTER
jgi:hypothetical protein